LKAVQAFNSVLKKMKTSTSFWKQFLIWNHCLIWWCQAGGTSSVPASLNTNFPSRMSWALSVGSGPDSNYSHILTCVIEFASFPILICACLGFSWHGVITSSFLSVMDITHVIPALLQQRSVENASVNMLAFHFHQRATPWKTPVSCRKYTLFTTHRFYRRHSLAAESNYFQ